jgi:hypothetical protein
MLIRDKASASREDIQEDGSSLMEAATKGKFNFLNQRGDLDNTSQDVLGVMITLIHGLVKLHSQKQEFTGLAVALQTAPCLSCATHPASIFLFSVSFPPHREEWLSTIRLR